MFPTWQMSIHADGPLLPDKSVMFGLGTLFFLNYFPFNYRFNYVFAKNLSKHRSLREHFKGLINNEMILWRENNLKIKICVPQFWVFWYLFERGDSWDHVRRSCLFSGYLLRFQTRITPWGRRCNWAITVYGPKYIVWQRLVVRYALYV